MTMLYYIVTGYDRTNPETTYGRLVGMPRAVMSVQLEGTVARLVTQGADMVTIEPISEEVFATFYQEQKGRWHRDGATTGTTNGRRTE